MGRGLYAAVVIIDNDHGRRWGHRYHHRRSMVVVVGQSSSNQHRLWSSLSLVVVVVERVRSTLTKHEDAHKHGGRGTANRRLDHILDRLLVHLFFGVEVVLANLDGETAVFIIVVIRDSRFVGVIPAVTPSLAPGLKGLKVCARHKSLTRIALASASTSSHSGVKSRSSDRLLNQQIDRIDRGRSVFARSVLPLVGSHSCRSRSRSKSMGLNKLKQYGQAMVDNWPWPGGHLM